MSEPITNVEDAVRELGALPMPVGPEPMSAERLAEIRNRKLSEVTPGPWLVADGAGGRPVVYVEEPLNGVVGARVLLAAESASEADVQFVASARRSVPELVTEVERLRARVAELEKELSKYVGKEPTVADEMAYLSRCLQAVHDLCDAAEKQATRWEHPLPVPEWVSKVRAALEGVEPRRSYRPALPWARLMDADDLEGLLADLADAASGDDDLTTLDEVESTIAQWRLIAEAQHAHNTAPGPDAEAGEPS